MTRTRDCPTCYGAVSADAEYCAACETFLVPHRRIGDILLEQGVVSEAQLDEVRCRQKQIGRLLVESGFVTDDQIDQAVQTQKTNRQRIIRDFLRRKRLKRLALLLLPVALLLALIQWDKLMKKEELRIIRQLDQQRFQASLVTDRVVLTAINWLKSDDPKTVDACWNLLKAATNQTLPKEAKAWEDWYRATVLAADGSSSTKGM